MTFRLLLPFLFCCKRDSNKEGAKRKKTVQCTVFADVGNERSEAIECGSTRKNPYSAPPILCILGSGIEDSHPSAEGAGFAYPTRRSVGGGAFDAPKNNKAKRAVEVAKRCERNE